MERRDAREFDRLDDLVHVDYEWDQVAENPGTQVVRGRENVKALLLGWTPIPGMSITQPPKDCSR